MDPFLEEHKYLMKMQAIYKSFSGVPALSGVGLALKPGEVHALLGENGAGKSTLMRILSGELEKDSGDIIIDGKPVNNLTPKKAQELGIALIHQEISLCPHLTVAENIYLGREPRKYGVLDKKKIKRQAEGILSSLNIHINPDALVGDLKVSGQQMVEIAKALSADAKIIIMDEPTSALASQEIDDLFKTVRTLKSQGRGVIYISHRLEELSFIADNVTILRDGKFIATMPFSETTQSEIISMMVGREITDRFPHIETQVGEVVFEARGINAGRLVRNISIELRKGEIVGIAGLVGAGRTELTRAIFGADKRQSGEIIVDGKHAKIRNPNDAKRAGVVLIPEDRKKDGLCTQLSVRHNFGLPNFDLLTKFGIVSRAKEGALSEKSKDDLKIKFSSLDNDAASLSGGNQQKLVVGKWIARDFKAVLFDEPTRGIDVGAKVEIYNIMNRLKKEGVGVMFVSSELQEILGMADRILVMCDGQITGELMRSEASQEKIIELATRFVNKVG